MARAVERAPGVTDLKDSAGSENGDFLLASNDTRDHPYRIPGGDVEDLIEERLAGRPLGNDS